MKSKLGLLIAIVVTVTVMALYWYGQRSKFYQLSVVNNSHVTADQVSLSGSGVEQPSSIRLGVDEHGEITVQLRSQGELRMLVVQGLNRIDSLLAEDVTQLDTYRKRLRIEIDNRYLIEDIKP